MAFELSTIVNYIIIAFIGFVFVMFFATKVKDIWKGKNNNKEVVKNETPKESTKSGVDKRIL